MDQREESFNDLLSKLYIRLIPSNSIEFSVKMLKFEIEYWFLLKDDLGQYY